MVRGKSVTLLGGGKSLALCLYDTDEIWTCNNLYRKVKRITKLFICHQQVYKSGVAHYDWKEMSEFSNRRGFGIITTHKIKGLKTQRYPLNNIMSKFQTDYFTDSVCYLLAYALYKGFNHLKLFGIDMLDEDNYTDERGGVEYWLGVATGLGCNIEISEGSALCHK